MSDESDDAEELRNGDELERVISRIRARLEASFSFPDEKVDSASAILALLRIMLAHAEAIVLVSKTPFAETGSANARAIFEAWVEIYSILEPGCEEANARRCVVFGLLEFRDHSIATGHLDADDLAKLEAVIAPYRVKYAGLIADVELQRTGKDKRSSQYWTGKGRGALMDAMEARGVASKLRSIYKMLSWDAHHVIAVAMRSSIRTNEEGTLEVGFQALQLPADSAEFNRYMAVQMLVKAWYQITTHLGIGPG